MPLIDFITTFNNSKKNVYRIDPLNTFDLHFDFTPSDSRIITFIKKSGFSDEVEFNANIKKFVQSITLPNFNVASDVNAETLPTTLTTHKMLLNTDSQVVTFEIINTRVPIMEEIFYPWMREIQMPVWSYEEYPYTTAEITINLVSHSNIAYHLLNCRPTYIESFNPSQSLGSITRQMMFTFDLMYIQYLGNYYQNGLNNLATKLINKGLKTIGL